MARGEDACSETQQGCEEPTQNPPTIAPRAVDPQPASRRDDQRDYLLVQAMVHGDRDALGVLYDHFAGEMLSVGRRFLGGTREAEDLVHDVFLEAWHRARYYDPTRGTVRTWLMLRLRSRALDLLRSARRAGLVGFEESQGTSAANTDPDATWRTNRVLHGELAELPAEQRIVLELGFFGGYSHAEIAAKLEIPLGTVKSRMLRAIMVLRSRLDSRKEQP